MSTTTLIVLIIVTLIALLSYAFITQTISQKRKQKLRLIAALKLRQKEFTHLSHGFPEGFLSQELNLLVHQCLVDVSSQLGRLEPGSTSHTSELEVHSQKLAQVKQQADSKSCAPLSNPAQIKEVKALLQGLHTFISNQQQKGHINATQFKIYVSEIQQMTLRLSTDSYLINARQAESGGKIKLALHFYDLAAKLLSKKAGADNSEQLSKINEKISTLSALEASNQQTRDQDGAGTGGVSSTDSEWEKFASEKSDEPWKKKTIYD